MTIDLPTLRDALGISRDAPAASVAERWSSLKDAIAKQGAGVPESVLQYVDELFDVGLHDVLVRGWNTTRAVLEALDESERSPDDVRHLELAKHTIESTHAPRIDVAVNGATVPAIELDATFTFTLKGFVLTIQAGSIREVRTGTCEARGVIGYHGFTVLKSKPILVTFPGSIAIGAPVASPRAPVHAPPLPARPPRSTARPRLPS